jgi:MFS family permease
VRLGLKLDVLRLRDFRLVYGAALVSLLGDGIVPVALAFAVLDLTGSATDLGIVLAARTLALVGSLLIGGVVADRIGRRAVMIGADLTRLVTQGAIGVLLVSGHATVLELAASQALLGAATGFFNPASSGLLPEVAGEWLQQANTLRGMATAAGNVAGPAIAAVLVVGVGSGWALLVDALSYAVSAALLAPVRLIATTPSRPEPLGVLVELREGFSEVRKRTWVWATILAASLANALLAALTVLGPLVAKQHLGGAGAWAAIVAGEGAGWAVGGIGLLQVTPRRPMLVATAASGTVAAPMLLLAVPAALVLIVAAMFVAGINIMLFSTLWETTLQQRIPAHARSRVSAYDWFGSLVLQPVGLALIGPFAAAVGVSTALYICGALLLAALTSVLGIRDIRRIGPLPVNASAADEPQNEPMAP